MTAESKRWMHGLWIVLVLAGACWVTLQVTGCSGKGLHFEDSDGNKLTVDEWESEQKKKDEADE